MNDTISPMMRQYLDIKNKHQDSILFFRLGDFYEMFFEDAKLVSEELDLTLTGKKYGKEEKAPMCGIPYHSCESYIARLIAKGYKIAMCDQVEDASLAKGLVRREVVRVITPGTVIEESMLDESKNNYICSIYSSSSIPTTGIAFCDVSTGELKVTEFFGNDFEIVNQIKTELGKFNPKEIICVLKNEIYKPLSKFIKDKLVCNVEILEDNINDYDSQNIIKEHFKDKELKFLNRISAVQSIAHLMEYLKTTQKGDLKHITFPVFYDKSEHMGLDLNTIRNLELVETMRTKSKKGSLLWVIDKTKTSMGKRLLRAWVERPLVDKNKIILRQDAVEELYKNIILRSDIRELLSRINDIQRLMTKISYASANAKDLKSLSSAIGRLPELRLLLEKTYSPMLMKMCSKMDTLQDIYSLIENSITQEPAISIKEGGIIKDGYSTEVDNLRKDMNCGKETVLEIQERERERTKIPKLKVEYNKIFGYYIEVTNPYKKLVPDDYMRKQTLTNCERYTTEELKNLESRIVYAKEKINETEYKIFEQIRNKVSENFKRIISVSNIVAALDVITSLAEVASCNNYVKPEINEAQSIIINQGRHPVIESLLSGTSFVPNDVTLDSDKNLVSIITGPNMAGKSTYMRQTALIVLMAQIGGFVPASNAVIGIVDNIFTRIGASDDLASGQSTFMVEMSEVADILKNATSKSLLIFDEIGRGTSTFDGMSIAKSVLEYVADKTKLGAKTLFATHYHELTCVADEFDNMKNYSIAVKKNGDTITFLHTIIPEAADDSYGIEVAKLAGLPDCVISRAKEILSQIEKEQNSNKSSESLDKGVSQVVSVQRNSEADEIVKELNDININNLTAIESINILYKLVGMAQKIHS